MYRIDVMKARRKLDSGSRRIGSAVLAMLMGALLLPFAAMPAQAKLASVGAVDTTTNFPSYYQDANGLRLEPCLEGPPLCLTAAADLAAPDGEAFYNSATANLTTRNAGKATL